MAKKDRPKKRSKHLVVQDNPFKTKQPPKQIAPMRKTNKSSINGRDYSNSSYKPIGEISGSYQQPKFSHHIVFTRQTSSEDIGTEVHRVEFYPFVDSVSESFTVNFNQTEKMGSPEPTYNYSGTSKQINLSWKSFDDDYGTEWPDDLETRIALLKSMVYPEIDTDGIVVSPPVVKLVYGPLRHEFASNPSDKEFFDTNELSNLERQTKELFGYITSLSIDYSSTDLGYRLDHNEKGVYGEERTLPTPQPRVVTFNVGFQQINKGIAGIYTTPSPVIGG